MTDPNLRVPGVYCAKIPMENVVYGHMVMISTRTTTTAEPVGCSTVFIGITNLWFTNRNAEAKTYSNTKCVISLKMILVVSQPSPRLFTGGCK